MAPAAGSTRSTTQQAADPQAGILLGRGRRPYQLESLATDGLRSQTRSDHVLEIVTLIFWINSIVLDTLREGHNGYPKITENLHQEFKALLTEKEVNVADKDKDLYESRIKGKIMEHLRNLTPDETSAVIFNEKPCQYYEQALRIRVTKTRASRQAIEVVEKNPSQPKPNWHNWCNTTQEYIEQLVVEMERNKHRLVVFLKSFKELQKSVQVAAKASLLSPKERLVLETRLRAVIEYYLEAYSTAYEQAEPQKHLLNMASENWWDASTETNTEISNETSTEREDGIHTPESVVSETYRRPKTMLLRLLKVAALIFFLISIIPAGFAWKYATTEKATLHDPNFCQTMTGSSLQISDFMDSMPRILEHSRLSQRNSILWALDGIGVLSILLSPVIYWFVSPYWSFIVSLYGVRISQKAVQLLDSFSELKEKDFGSIM